MKKYVFFILITIPLITRSQAIFTDDKLWSTVECTDDNICRSYYTKITSDTTLNNMQYRKVMNTSDPLMINWSLAGFIREVDQKVFYKKKNVSAECLLYDFGCSVGDTLNLNCSCGEDSKFIVDSINYKSVMGVERKHIYVTYLLSGIDTIFGDINNAFVVEYWIEGIGSNGGILNGGGSLNCFTGGGTGLLCCSEDDKIIYMDTYFNSCYVLTSEPNVKQEDELIEVYNIGENVVTVKPLTGNSGIIQIFDISGNQIIQEGIELKESQICLPATGAYIYRFIAKTGEVQNGKVVVR